MSKFNMSVTKIAFIDLTNEITEKEKNELIESTNDFAWSEGLKCTSINPDHVNDMLDLRLELNDGEKLLKEICKNAMKQGLAEVVFNWS